jgi:hypothetical protein
LKEPEAAKAGREEMSREIVPREKAVPLTRGDGFVYAPCLIEISRDTN